MAIAYVNRSFFLKDTGNVTCFGKYCPMFLEGAIILKQDRDADADSRAEDPKEGLLLLKCVLDNNIIPTTRGPTKPAVLRTVGSFTKVEARYRPPGGDTMERASGLAPSVLPGAAGGFHQGPTPARSRGGFRGTAHEAQPVNDQRYRGTQGGIEPTYSTG